MGTLPGTEYLPAFVPASKWFHSHVRWSPQLIFLLLRAKHGIMFIYLFLKVVSPFTGCGKERLVSGEQRARMPRARQSSQPASLLERKAVAPRDRGKEYGSPWFGLGILAMACSQSCAFLRRRSPALKVLSTVRFCGVPVGTVKVPQG